ncbi:MAG: hypothetical protein V2A73_00340 [Pseudomonadota bacterium]
MLRVFPRRTAYTPIDDMAFVGDPPLIWPNDEKPEANEVHVSVAFTWDVDEGQRLAEAWRHHYPIVKVGGPAMGSKPNGFTPGLYIRRGVTFTSRGCNGFCPWCLVPQREGKLRLCDPIPEGYVVQDNNFLQCPRSHRQRVYQMLARQRRAALFAGGLQASLVNDQIADELRGLRIESVFLAADTRDSLWALERALKKLAFLPRRKLRCYTMVGYGNELLDEAEERLETIWRLGAMPFAQLYRPPEGRAEYSREWAALARKWSRPAAMMATHKSKR